jgi:hypothetical protein
VTLSRSGLRWCQAASTSNRRAWLFPVFVIALPPLLAARVLARGQAKKRPERLRPEPVPVAQLDAQPERGQSRDPAQAAEAADDLGERRLAGELGDRPVERVPARFGLQHRPVAVVESERERAAIDRCRRSQASWASVQALAS